MFPSDEFWIWGVRFVGVMHFVTLVAAWYTPIPPNWGENLSKLPDLHRRFAEAQNVFIGLTIGFLGLICLFFPEELISRAPLARMVCGGIALWWGGRLSVLAWLGVGKHILTRGRRFAFMLLRMECAIYLFAFGWLALGG